MQTIFRKVLLLSLAAFAAAGHAQTCDIWRNQLAPGDYASKELACNAGLAVRNTILSNDYYWGNVQLSWSVVTCTDSGVTYSAMGSIGSTTTTYIQTKTTGPCPNPCNAGTGTSSVVNVTVGYTRSTTDTKVVGTPFNPWAPGASACNNGCKVTFGTAVAAYVSKSPTANGLYRNSVDMNSVQTNEQCLGSDDPVNPNPAGGPACPGSLGTVNGKPYCAGTAANPVANDQPVDSPMPPTDGNPTAGTKPASGEGSGTGAGRTPSAGGGGPEGGPSAAAGGGGTIVNTGSNGNPTGTVTMPDREEQAACGAPGQPKCQIDETGTPTTAQGQAMMDGAGGQVDTTKEGVLGAFEAHKTLEAPAWTWTFSLPSGCTPYVMDAFNGFVLDVCRWQPIIHDIMSMLWIGAAIWGCIALVGRTTGVTA